MTEGESSETLIRGDIENVARQVADLQESLRSVESVREGLRGVGGIVGRLSTNLEHAVETQRETEDARRVDADHNRQRFWITIGGILLANVVVITISVFVLLGQIEARDLSEARSMTNRDRQSCATSLLVEWDARLGDALRVTTQFPIVPPESPQYRQAVDALNAATELIGRAQELCYGPEPNPNPVPG